MAFLYGFSVIQCVINKRLANNTFCQMFLHYHMRHQTAEPSSGFSLIELISTLLILAILSALVVPRANMALGQFNLDSSAQQLVSDMRMLQEMSFTHMGIKRVTFAAGAEGYDLMLNNGYVYKSVTFPSGITITTPDQEIRIRNGEPYKSPPFWDWNMVLTSIASVTLHSSVTDTTVTVDIYPHTGYAVVR